MPTSPWPRHAHRRPAIKLLAIALLSAVSLLGNSAASAAPADQPTVPDPVLVIDRTPTSQGPTVPAPTDRLPVDSVIVRVTPPVPDEEWPPADGLPGLNVTVEVWNFDGTRIKDLGPDQIQVDIGQDDVLTLAPFWAANSVLGFYNYVLHPGHAGPGIIQATVENRTRQATFLYTIEDVPECWHQFALSTRQAPVSGPGRATVGVELFVSDGQCAALRSLSERLVQYALEPGVLAGDLSHRPWDPDAWPVRVVPGSVVEAADGHVSALIYSEVAGTYEVGDTTITFSQFVAASRPPWTAVFGYIVETIHSIVESLLGGLSLPL
jgi:hypothetical protein